MAKYLHAHLTDWDTVMRTWSTVATNCTCARLRVFAARSSSIAQRCGCDCLRAWTRTTPAAAGDAAQRLRLVYVLHEVLIGTPAERLHLVRRRLCVCARAFVCLCLCVHYATCVIVGAARGVGVRLRDIHAALIFECVMWCCAVCIIMAGCLMVC